MRLFSPDSKFMRAMSRLADLVLLNMAFLLCCLPLVTAGAACTALYTVCFRMVRDAEGHVLGQFFRAFRQSFRTATPLWLLLALAGAVAVLDIWLFAGTPGALRLLLALFGLLLLLVLFTASYAFPLLSQFENSALGTLKNALILSLAHLPRTLAVTALNVFPVALLLFEPYLFLWAGLIWIGLYFSAAAYLGAKLLDGAFAPYREDRKEDAP
ncbi:MAG: YesL family protein [Oscillospiraceae bacterium]|nr:YesL family protein [Oscillospiraceae bacterium]